VKVVELANGHPSLDEVIALAKQELVVLRGADGSVFALSEVDDFDVEVELLKNNREFMSFLRQRSQERSTVSLEELRRDLGL
jgi:hypothetical protein